MTQSLAVMPSKALYEAAIQCIGIVPEFQNRGRTLLAKSLHALRQDGLSRATLEVTVQDAPAVRFYERFHERFHERFGFRHKRATYRRVLIDR